MKRKRKKVKNPSIIRRMIDVLYEDAQRRKAVRILEKQAWSLDFIAAALAKAGRGLDEGLVLVITDKNGVKMEMRYADVKDNVNEDSVFMHLDDDAFVDRFIREMSRR